MIKKNIAAVFTAIISIICLYSCSSNEPFIGVTIYSSDDVFANYIKVNLDKAYSGKVKYIISDSKNSQITQNGQIDQYISKGAKVLVINLVDTYAADTIIDKVKEQNIPIIFYNKAPAKSSMDSYKKVWYVGTYSEEAANMQGKIVVNSWNANPSWDKNGDGKIQCVILQGEPGHYDTEIRTKNVISFIENSGLEVEVLYQKTAMWDKERAKIIVDEWMSDNSNSNLEYIIANNDSMALGALNSIQSIGYNTGDSNKYIPIVGIDAINEVVDEIANGNIVGTVLNDSFSQAKAVADLSLSLFNGNVNPILGTTWTLDNNKSVRIHYKPITLENLDEIRR